MLFVVVLFTEVTYISLSISVSINKVKSILGIYMSVKYIVFIMLPFGITIIVVGCFITDIFALNWLLLRVGVH